MVDVRNVNKMCWKCGKNNKEQGLKDCYECRLCEVCVQETPRYCRGGGVLSFKIIVATENDHDSPIQVESKLTKSDLAYRRLLKHSFSTDGKFFALTGESGHPAVELFEVGGDETFSRPTGPTYRNNNDVIVYKTHVTQIWLERSDLSWVNNSDPNSDDLMFETIHAPGKPWHLNFSSDPHLVAADGLVLNFGTVGVANHTSPQMHGKGKYVVTSSGDKSVRVWTTQRRLPIHIGGLIHDQMRQVVHAHDVGGTPECYGFDATERYMLIHVKGNPHLTIIFDLIDSGRIVARIPMGVEMAQLKMVVGAPDRIFEGSRESLKVWQFGGGKISEIIDAPERDELSVEEWSVAPRTRVAVAVMANPNDDCMVLRRVCLDQEKPLHSKRSLAPPSSWKVATGKATLADWDLTMLASVESGNTKQHWSTQRRGVARVERVTSRHLVVMNVETEARDYFDLASGCVPLGTKFGPTAEKRMKAGQDGQKPRITFEPPNSHRYCLVQQTKLPKKGGIRGKALKHVASQLSLENDFGAGENSGDEGFKCKDGHTEQMSL
jgi:hypothetical protein